MCVSTAIASTAPCGHLNQNTFWSNCVLLSHFHFILDFGFRQASTHTHAFSHSVCSCETFTSAGRRFSFNRLWIYSISSDSYVTRLCSKLVHFHSEWSTNTTCTTHQFGVHCSNVSIIETLPDHRSIWDLIERFYQLRHPEMNERKNEEQEKNRASFVFLLNGQNVIALFAPSSVWNKENSFGVLNSINSKTLWADNVLLDAASVMWYRQE